MPERVISDLLLTAWDLRVFCVLARHSRKDKASGALIPAKIRTRTIAQKLGLEVQVGKRIVSRAIRHLEQRGHLKIMRRRGATSSHDLNPAWRPTDNVGVVTSDQPTDNTGVVTSDNVGVVTHGQSDNKNDTPPSSEKDISEGGAAERAAAVSRLVSQGVGKSQAAKLVQDFGIEVIEAQIELLPQRTADDPIRVLVASIKGNWPPPRRDFRDARMSDDDKKQPYWPPRGAPAAAEEFGDKGGRVKW